MGLRWPWQRKERKEPALRIGEEVSIDGQPYLLTNATWDGNGTIITLQDKDSCVLAAMRVTR